MDELTPRRGRELKLLSWYIAGWQAKKNNQQFITFLKQYDIIFLQETWHNDPILLNGYCCHSLPTTPSLRGGRPSGGLASLVSTELEHSLRVLPSCNSLATAVLVNLRKEALLLVNVYLPPCKKKSVVKANWEELEAFLEPLEFSYPSTPIIIGGDFNAHMGTDDHNLYSQYNQIHDPGNTTDTGLTRLSRDSRCNYSGLCLAQVAKRRELTILNGNKAGDRPGEYTHFSKAGGSVIDYILISRFAYNLVLKFQVGHNTESDHLPLTLALDGPPLTKPMANLYFIPTANLSLPVPRRIKWTPILNTELIHLLHSEEVKTIHSAIVSANAASLALDLFKVLFERLKSFLTSQILRTSTKRAKDSARWFDAECRQARKLLRLTYRKYRNSGAPSLFAAYVSLRRNYKQTLKRKKQKAERTAWGCLVKASNEKDTTCFWRTIAGLLDQERNGPICTVEPQEWMRYFQTLYQDEESQQKEVGAQPGDLPSWHPVSAEQVAKLIAQLKNNKAPGIDYIPAELLKANIGWWAPLLAKMFSYIDSTGIILSLIHI